MSYQKHPNTKTKEEKTKEEAGGPSPTPPDTSIPERSGVGKSGRKPDLNDYDKLGQRGGLMLEYPKLMYHTKYKPIPVNNLAEEVLLKGAGWTTSPCPPRAPGLPIIVEPPKQPIDPAK